MSGSSFGRTFLAALVLAGGTPTFAASTAKAALKEVVAAGQKWQPDAVVTHVSTIFGQPNGKARTWLYTVYSPKAKKSANITTQDLKIIEVLEVPRNTSVDPIGDFVDSDKATEAAVKAGLKLEKAKESVAMGLTTGNQAVGKPSLFWSVTVIAGNGFSAVTLNGKDGTFVKRDDVSMK